MASKHQRLNYKGTKRKPSLLEECRKFPECLIVQDQQLLQLYERLHRWLSEQKTGSHEYESGHREKIAGCPIAVLVGPTGAGKTTLLRAALQSCQYDWIEFNTHTVWNSSKVLETVKNVEENNSLVNGTSHIAFVFEELDIILDIEPHSNLNFALLSSKCKYPILVTCNNFRKLQSKFSGQFPLSLFDFTLLYNKDIYQTNLSLYFAGLGDRRRLGCYSQFFQSESSKELARFVCHVSGIWNWNLFSWISDLLKDHFQLLEAECYDGPLFSYTLSFACYRYAFHKLSVGIQEHLQVHHSFLMNNLLSASQTFWGGNWIGAQALKLVIEPSFLSLQGRLGDEEDNSLMEEIVLSQRCYCRQRWINEMKYKLPNSTSCLVSSRILFTEILPSAFAILTFELQQRKRQCKFRRSYIERWEMDTVIPLLHSFLEERNDNNPNEEGNL